MRITWFEDADLKALEDSMARAVARALKTVAKDYLPKLEDRQTPTAPDTSAFVGDPAFAAERDNLRAERDLVTRQYDELQIEFDKHRANYDALKNKYDVLANAAHASQPWPAETDPVKPKPPFALLPNAKLPPPEVSDQPDIREPEPKNALGLAFAKAHLTPASVLKAPEPEPQQPTLTLPTAKRSLRDVCPTVATRPPNYITRQEAVKILTDDGVRPESAEACISLWLYGEQIPGRIVCDNKWTPTKGLPGRLMVDKGAVQERNRLRKENAGLPRNEQREAPRIELPA